MYQKVIAPDRAYLWPPKKSSLKDTDIKSKKTLIIALGVSVILLTSLIYFL